MNAAGAPVWHKQIVRAVNGQTRPNTQKRSGKSALPSSRSELVDGSPATIYIAAFQHKQIAGAVKDQTLRVAQSRGKGALCAVRSEFKDDPRLPVVTRHKQILRRRAGASQNDCSQTQYRAQQTSREGKGGFGFRFRLFVF